MAASPFAISTGSSATRPVWRFGLLCVAFVVLWVIGTAYGLGTNSSLDSALCRQLAVSSAWGLRLLGWQASADTVQPGLVLLNGQPGVIVGAPCDGLVLYALLAGFVLAYPGPARRRLWFIPLGIVGLWVLNIIRIIVLALNHQYSPGTFEFDHHYAFNAVAYSALGGLWLLWTRQSSLAAAPELVASHPAATQPVATGPLWLTARAISGLVLLVILIAGSIFRDQVLAVLGEGWAALLVSGPAWLHRLPGATPGTMPAGVSKLALPVGAAYTGFFLVMSLLILRLLLPSSGWRVVWRCYAGLGLAYLLLLLIGRAGAGQSAYRVARMLLDFVVSLLPIAGLLVLLWRPTAVAAGAPSDRE